MRANLFDSPMKFKGELDVDSKPVELKEEKRSEVGFEEKEDEIETGLYLEKVRLRRRRQNMKRTNMMAKPGDQHPICCFSGFLGDWVVLVVEVKPNLFSGEAERFLLEDVSQVGDVVLVPIAQEGMFLFLPFKPILEMAYYSTIIDLVWVCA
ncbi:hypothetical protein QYF36_021677 [Acer negundo]|nr:hypothetical protein QYF36_021677 [Acer negundo]